MRGAPAIAAWVGFSILLASPAGAEPTPGPSTLHVHSTGAVVSEAPTGAAGTRALTLMLSDVASVCELLARSSAGRQVNAAGITVTLLKGGGEPIGPGVYPVDAPGALTALAGKAEPSPESPTATHVVAGYGKMDAHCRNVVGASGSAEQGEVTLTAVSPTAVRGHLELRFLTGERVSLSFDAPLCQATAATSARHVPQESCVGERDLLPGPTELDEALARMRQFQTRCQGPSCRAEVRACADGGRAVITADFFTGTTDYFDRRGARVGSRMTSDDGEDTVQGATLLCAPGGAIPSP